MTLTVDSDINGPSPQFTLTCISTGGPATTVTWTRDSVIVTEGTETVLDDPVTTQYTHTLTVTGRLGGLYTCTVANNKPSSDTASINVPGILLKVMIYIVYIVPPKFLPSSARPESVTFHPVNATAVRVSWSDDSHHSTSLQYTSIFTATGAVISRYVTVLPPPVNDAVVAIDTDRDGYEQNFTLHYISTDDLMIPAPAPVTIATFAFGKLSEVFIENSFTVKMCFFVQRGDIFRFSLDLLTTASTGE